MSSIVNLSVVSNSIMPASEFSEKIKQLRCQDAEAKSAAAKLRAAKRKRQLRELSIEARGDWIRVLNRIASIILGEMLDKRYSSASLDANILLGHEGVQRYNYGSSDSNSGILEQALRAEDLLNKWLYGSYVDGKFNLRDFVKIEYSISTDMYDLGISTRSRRRYSCRTIRYYDIENEKMEKLNKKRNTFVFTILDEIENILLLNGYDVDNTVKLDKWKNTKSTIYYSGVFTVSAK